MPKLYFKWGCMNSSKSAQALMTKFNYMEKGYTVALMKPSVDQRDGADMIHSRIGLTDRAELIHADTDLYRWFLKAEPKPDVIIIDEAQFLTGKQVEQLKDVAIEFIPVLCFGLKNDFRTYLFPGSKRLLEISDSIAEIKSICKCGRKAEVNARIQNGKIVRVGEQIQIGGNESYQSLCYNCWKNDRL